MTLGETSDSCTVTFLNWPGAREADMVVPEAMEKARLECTANDQVVSLESDVMLSAIFARQQRNLRRIVGQDYRRTAIVGTPAVTPP